MALRNTTQDSLEVKKHTLIARVEAADQVPPVTGPVNHPSSEQELVLSEAERQALLLEKLDLSSLENWSPEVATKARDLLCEYHDIFSVEKNELGHTKAVQHKIVLKDPESVPFRERFRCIPPPQVEEVREHLKVMLEP